jgi:hypothetical protein
LDVSLRLIVSNEFQESCGLLVVSALVGRGSRSLVFARPVIGHPLAPFVVGKEGGGDEEDSEDAEEDFHGVYRIARIETAG